MILAAIIFAFVAVISVVATGLCIVASRADDQLEDEARVRRALYPND